MLSAIERATGIAPERIGWLVNTHANGDHTHGNALVPNAEVICSEAAAREFSDLPPAVLADFKRRGMAGEAGAAGSYFAAVFEPFDFTGVRGRPPTRTFDRRLDLRVGDKAVELHMLGPAHTGGDTLAWLPDDRTVFTGDLLFADRTPIMWAGPVGNWLAACDRILALGALRIIPGHGPLADTGHVERLRGYLQHVQREARLRFDAGMSAVDAGFDIGLGGWRDWPEPERLAVNVDTLYREFRGGGPVTHIVELFERMALLRRRGPR